MLQVEKSCCKKYFEDSTLCKMLGQLATLKFVARQVEHAVVIRATTRSTCNATMLRDKLQKVLPLLPGNHSLLSLKLVACRGCLPFLTLQLFQAARPLIN